VWLQWITAWQKRRSESPEPAAADNKAAAPKAAAKAGEYDEAAAAAAKKVGPDHPSAAQLCQAFGVSGD
jgi:hypothetical protein